jgi:hypothetical protein
MRKAFRNRLGGEKNSTGAENKNGPTNVGPLNGQIKEA